jgi:heme exporter protein D
MTISRIVCDTHLPPLSTYGRSICPARMYCVPHPVMDAVLDVCSSEVGWDLLVDTSTGHCKPTAGSYILALIFALITIFAIVVCLWLAYVTNFARRSKVLKFNYFTIALFFLQACSHGLWISTLARIGLIFSTDAVTYDRIKNLNTGGEMLSRVFTVLAFGVSGRVMFTTLLNVLRLPYEEKVERKRTVRLFSVLMAFLATTSFLRVSFVQYPVAYLAGLVLMFVCWLIFRRGKNKMSEDIAFRLLRQSEQMLGDVLAQAIRRCLISFLKMLSGCAIAMIIEAFAWYGMRLYGPKKSFSVIMTIGNVGIYFWLAYAVWSLTKVITTITQYRINASTSLQAIAIIVGQNSSNSPRGGDKSNARQVSIHAKPEERSRSYTTKSSATMASSSSTAVDLDPAGFSIVEISELRVVM